MKRKINIVLLIALFVALLPLSEVVSADKKKVETEFYPKDEQPAVFSSRFIATHDRRWPGGDYWTNPMEDWEVADGRLECTKPGKNRNIHLLTHVLGSARGEFSFSVQTGAIELGNQGSVGFRIGVREPEIDDYRGNVFFGKGLNVGVTVDGHLLVAGEKKQLGQKISMENLELEVIGQPLLHNYKVTLKVRNGETGELIGELSADDIPGDKVTGNVALVNNFYNTGSRFWFQNWEVDGAKIVSYPDRSFGPIMWSMYSLSDSQSKEGHILKISAQMPPLGQKDNNKVELQTWGTDGWKSHGHATIDPLARNAIFRVPNWSADRNVRYRLIYDQKDKESTIQRDVWSGIIQKDPIKSQELVIASLNCQKDAGFPYGPVAENVKKINPDMVTFHGDQIYEGNGGYGVIRNAKEEGLQRATVNYLRKYFMFGWAFRDVMRDRPTLLMPDDHDVFQGNIWGEGGAAPQGSDFSASGGYLMPPEFVNMVFRSQTGHHPELYDPTPIKRDIDVWYGDMLYGGVSFAIISERMFKSGPGNVDTGEGRADLIETPDYDPEALDKPGLTLLGDRQLNFLEHWVQDWKGARMKVLLGQTPYANLNTHSGHQGARLYADLDTNGWPQTPRDNALRVLRKGFVFHLNGDQHLPTVINYGIDEPQDANWGFCPPGITVGWPRWWLADQIGLEAKNRPNHGLPNTGQYTGPFGNLGYLYAVGNPTALDGATRYTRSQNKASGFGVVRLDTKERSIRMEAYRFLADIGNDAVDNQFPGWPVTVGQLDNYNKNRAGYLQEVTHQGAENPVVKVYNEETGDLVYALRSPTGSFRPFVFEEGSYKVMIGNPENDSWSSYENLKIE